MGRPSVSRRPVERPRESGVALVIILSFLVLLSVMVLGFLARMGTERSASGAYYENNRSALLADLVVNIVRTQIDAATNEEQNGRSAAWASQPGMVRTFKTDGSLLRAYKLYSDDTMISATVDPAAEVNRLNQWWESPALYVDLNAPGLNAETGRLVYPILDNAVLERYTEADNGFKVVNAPVSGTSSPNQAIPMPVKWLYVLEDGSVVAPTGSGKKVTVPGASRSNPIVGRVAFWTDDETCKLNINTASHGQYWDLPRVSTFEDRDRLARYQPARNEFQRYPGHPATTSLLPAFEPGLFSGEEAFAQFAYQVAPRIQYGGSEGGTKNAIQPVTLDEDRLYSSVDELLYRPDRSIQLSEADLSKARFFLTARSNAPEVSLLNLPRMAIWPINAGSKSPSIIDRQIAAAATIGGKPYYLQRSNPSSSSADLNDFGGRNLQLWDYINNLLSVPTPGFGNASFVTKYTRPEVEQITTEIFDYIRSSNLYSTALGATAYTGDINVNPASLSPRRKPGTRVGQVTPLKIGNTKGFGRIPTITRAIFQLYISGAEIVKPNGELYGNPWYPVYNGTTPKYTAPHSVQPYAGWRSFLNTFKDAPEGSRLQFLTNGIVYFDTFDPNLGYTIPRYHFEVETEFYGDWQVEGLDANGNSLGLQSLGFPSNPTLKINLDHNQLYDSKSNNSRYLFMPRYLGGQLGVHWMMQNYSDLQYPDVSKTRNVIGTPVVDGVNYLQIFNAKGGYPLVGRRVRVHRAVTPVEGPNGITLPNVASLPAEEQTSLIRFTGGGVRVRLRAGGNGGNGGEVVQTFDFYFPPFEKPAPAYLDDQTRAQNNVFQFDKDKQFPISADFRHRWMWCHYEHGFFYPQGLAAGGSWAERNYVDLRTVPDWDVAVSLVPKHGDKRLIAAKSTLGGDDFQPHEFYNDTARRVAIDCRPDHVNHQTWVKITPGSSSATGGPGRILSLNYGRNALPDIPGHLRNGVQQALGLDFPPDFDNGPFYHPDDAYINRADEGSVRDDAIGTGSGAGNDRDVAWYLDIAVNNDSLDKDYAYSPKRQMPSAVMFGSLPTGVVRGLPWQTLLFRPDPGNHPGAQNPPDYTLLDHFWMPVADPYPLSERFSTNGKVNMNYQIMPFTYIHRATALHGVLQSEELLAIPNGAVGKGTNNGLGVLADDDYKLVSPNANDHLFSDGEYRKKIDVLETLKGFEARFNAGRLFRSETEICSLPIIPEGETYRDNFETWWDNYRITGDNARERIYATLLPRLTTRSNTYTVHYMVQTLRQPPRATDEECQVWDEDKGMVASTHRGSRMIERYIDPNDSAIPDYAPDPFAHPSLVHFYRWREFANREFAP